MWRFRPKYRPIQLIRNRHWQSPGRCHQKASHSPGWNPLASHSPGWNPLAVLNVGATGWGGSGAHAVLLLAAMCERVSLYGFAQVRFCRYRFCATGELNYRGAVGLGRVRIQVHV
jgi:hypothetical protein